MRMYALQQIDIALARLVNEVLGRLARAAEDVPALRSIADAPASGAQAAVRAAMRGQLDLASELRGEIVRHDSPLAPVLVLLIDAAIAAAQQEEE